MSKTGVTIATECMDKYQDLKDGKLRYVIYKISDDNKQIVVENTSPDPNWEEFQQKLLDAKASHKGKEGKGPRYAVYDFRWEIEEVEGTRNRTMVMFISWSPDEGALVAPRMIYAASKESFKNALNGLAGEIQANRQDDIEYDTIFEKYLKGKR
ncbi:MAG: hypothetical protein Q9163_005208 [Psora crenata]